MRTSMSQRPWQAVWCGLGCRGDSARLFSYEEVSKWGAGGQILLERLLPELAFKLGRASKYGA